MRKGKGKGKGKVKEIMRKKTERVSARMFCGVYKLRIFLVVSRCVYVHECTPCVHLYL